MAFRVKLFCCDCAGKREGQDVSTIDARGEHETDVVGLTDGIGWCVPAIPTAEGDAFWGYGKKLPAAVAWWRALPTRPRNAEADFLAAVKALASYKAVVTSDDEQATIAAREQAVIALQRCADAGAPVLRWMLLALHDVDCLVDIFTREGPNAEWICRVENILRGERNT